MTLSEAKSAVREDLQVDTAEVTEGCTYATHASFPAGVGFMITADTVSRVDVYEGAITNREGFGIGSAEADLIAKYRGTVRVEPHPYSGPEWHYVIHLEAADTMFGYIFETDGKNVKNFRAGRQPALMWIEGCL